MPTLRAATDPEVEAGDYFGSDGFFELRDHSKRVRATEAAHDAETAARLRGLSVQRTGIDVDAALSVWSAILGP